MPPPVGEAVFDDVRLLPYGSSLPDQRQKEIGGAACAYLLQQAYILQNEDKTHCLSDPVDGFPSSSAYSIGMWNTQSAIQSSKIEESVNTRFSKAQHVFKKYWPGRDV